jgi:uncharacterized membrane protein YphA (DoxX/SURF4 family)
LEEAAVGSPQKRLARIHTLARIGIAAVWIYHGLVPKLLYRDWSEMDLLHDMGVEIAIVPMILQTFAYLEISLGLLVLAHWRHRWPLWATIGIMIGGLLSVAKHSPKVLHAAFNPVTLNGLMLALAVIALISQSPPVSKTAKSPSN